MTDFTNDIPTPSASAEPMAWTLRYEVFAIVGVVLLALLLRLAELDLVPMSDLEANRALFAWAVAVPNAPAFSVPTAESVLTFWGQVWGLSTFQQGEMGARLFGVVAGVLLTLTPLLFRARLGAVGALVWMLALAVSPLALGASRTSEPALWVALSAVFTLWALWKYWDTRHLTDASLFALGMAGLLFLSGGGGLIFALALLVAGVFALSWTLKEAPLELDAPAEAVFTAVSDAVRAYPFGWGLAVLIVSVGAVATGFMTYPSGLGMVGEGIALTLSRLVASEANPLPFYPLAVLVAYDGASVLLALLGYASLHLLGRQTLADRFALLAMGFSALALLFYRSGSPADGLWVVMPMGWLVARAIDEALRDRPFYAFWAVDLDDALRHRWVKWMIALLCLLLLLALAFHLQAVGRGLVTVPPQTPLGDAISRAFVEPALWNFRLSVVWTLLISLFGVVGALLLASIWGNRITIQGVALGFFAFALISGTSTGFNGVAVQADRPTHLWHMPAVSPDLRWLRQTLLEVAQRDTRGFPSYAITVVRDDSIGLSPYGAFAWQLRDFSLTRFVPTLADAQREQVIITPPYAETPNLGGSYVGQSFAMRPLWGVQTLEAKDWLGWATARRINAPERPTTNTLLWLRIDVYDATPINTRPR